MPARIMVVDDEADVRSLVGLWLKSEGYEVSSAEDGADCLSKLKRAKADLVLLDIMMPGLKVGDILKGIKKLSKKIKVVYFTAVDWSNETAEQRKRGFIPVFEPPVVGYIKKPATKAVIVGEVKAVLGEKSAA